MTALPAGRTPAPWRIMLVDDHAVVRAGYRRLIEDEPDLRVVAEHADADSAYQALGACAAQGGGSSGAMGGDGVPVDVLVLDLSMPGRSGLDMLHRLRQRWSRLKVLVFSMHDSPAMVAQAVQAGAAGFVTKRSAPEVLVQALRRVALGEAQVLSPDLASLAPRVAGAAPHQALSVREFDVLRGLAEGLTLDEIAQRLHISPKTVSNLQSQVRQRLGVSTAVELLHYASEHRLFAA